MPQGGAHATGRPGSRPERGIPMQPRTYPTPAQSIVFAACLLAAPCALADQSIGFSWNHCQGEIGATQNVVFACETNNGTQNAEATFTLATPMSVVTGTDSELRILSASPTLPAWWMLVGA